MYPRLEIALFGLEISLSSYALFAFLGGVAAVLTALPALKRAGLAATERFLLLGSMILAFLAGARVWNYAVNPGNFSGELNLLTLRLAGLSLYGGLFAAGILLIVWSSATRQDIWLLLDGFVLPMALAFILARIGCFFNGCCQGKATKSFLGVVFPQSRVLSQSLLGTFPLLGELELAVHPTQLYEAGLALIGLVAILIAGRKRALRQGSLFLAYAVYFNLIRLLILPLRSLAYPKIVLTYFYPTLYVSLIILGTVLLYRRERQVS